MAAAEYRQPSVAEAVALICASLTIEYRRDCLKFWRERFGDSFAITVEREVMKAWGKRAGRPR